jgi:hypothetical protein
MPVSLSAIRGQLSGAGTGAKGSRLVVRGGRAYKLVPAGAKMQRRHKRTSGGGRGDRMFKLMELALIAQMMRSH